MFERLTTIGKLGQGHEVATDYAHRARLIHDLMQTAAEEKLDLDVHVFFPTDSLGDQIMMATVGVTFGALLSQVARAGGIIRLVFWLREVDCVLPESIRRAYKEGHANLEIRGCLAEPPESMRQWFLAFDESRQRALLIADAHNTSPLKRWEDLSFPTLGRFSHVSGDWHELEPVRGLFEDLFQAAGESGNVLRLELI